MADILQPLEASVRRPPIRGGYNSPHPDGEVESTARARICVRPKLRYLQVLSFLGDRTST